MVHSDSDSGTMYIRLVTMAVSEQRPYAGGEVWRFHENKIADIHNQSILAIDGVTIVIFASKKENFF